MPCILWVSIKTSHKTQENEMNIKLNKKTNSKIEKICKLFIKETGEDLTRDDCMKLSVEALWEEVDSFGIDRMFLRKHLWEKNVVYLNGKDKIIGSQ